MNATGRENRGNRLQSSSRADFRVAVLDDFRLLHEILAAIRATDKQTRVQFLGQFALNASTRDKMTADREEDKDNAKQRDLKQLLFGKV